MPEEETSKLEQSIAVLSNEIKHIQVAIEEIRQLIERGTSTYVSRAEFEPVQKIVYGGIKVILVAFLGGVVALVWTLK